MARNYSHLMVTCAAAMTLNASAATPHRIECPAEIPQASVSITNPPKGWTSYARTGLRLTYAEPMFGPPSEKGFLKPSRSTADSDVWNDLEGNVEGGKWIACRYGGHGEVLLSKRISDSTTACTVFDKKDKHGINHPEVTCIW